MSVESKFKLIWDKVAGRKLEQDAQESLRKGTDPKKAKENLTAVERAMDGLKGAAYRLGYAIGAAFAISKIKDFAAASIKEFGEAQAVWSRLEGTLNNVGVSLTDVRDEIDATVSSMERLTTMGDEDVASALTTLTQLSGDYAGSLQRIQLVADLAAGANISYEQSAELVGKAMAGNTMLLTRMFPALKDSKDILGDLATLQDGMAERQRGTWAGAMSVITKEWGNFKEAVGEALVEAGGGTSILETLIGTIKGLTQRVNEGAPAIQSFLSDIKEIASVAKEPIVFTISVAGDAVSGVANMLRDIRELRGDLDRRRAEAEFRAGVGPRPGPYGAGGTWSTPGGNSAPAPMIPNPRDVPLSNEEKEAAAARAKALRDYINEWSHSEQAFNRVTKLAVPERGPNLTTVNVGNRPAPVVEPRELSRTEQAFYDLYSNITAASDTAAYEMSAAFEDAFRLILQEGATVGNFFEGLGRGAGGALLQGLADFFRVKVKQNIAAAIEAAAFALGFASHGNFASASAAWASAGQHAAAATAYAAAGGLSGAGRAAITGGRGASPSTSRDVGLATARGTTPTIPQAIIYVDPFNPGNPIHVQQIGKGMALDVRLNGKPDWVRS